MSNIQFVHYTENWAPITNIVVQDIQPYYWISSYGRIWSTFSNKFLSVSDNGHGYLQINLKLQSGGRKTMKVHRLVLLSFWYFNGCEIYEVNHLDGNPYNNHLSNLEWATPYRNVHHAMETGLRHDFGEQNVNAVITDDEAEQICLMYINGKSCKEITEIIGCPFYIVNHIISGNTRPYLKEKYNLQIKHQKVFNEDEIHIICRIFKDRLYMYENKLILFSEILQLLNKEETPSSISTLYKLSTKSIYNKITSQYKY